MDIMSVRCDDGKILDWVIVPAWGHGPLPGKRYLDSVARNKATE